MSDINALLSDPLLSQVPVYDGYKVFGPVVLFDRIGTASMGAVYRGRHLRLNVDVAVKLISPPAGLEVEQREAFMQRFTAEAQLAAAVIHHNLVRVIDVLIDFGLCCLVMEFIDGDSAEELLKLSGPLTERDAVEVCLKAADGLAKAHAVNVVHCDVTPYNILVSRKGEVKVTDLCMARVLGIGENNMILGITDAQSVLGMPYYMPPELTRPVDKVDPSADVWSLGVTLYHMITGELPFNESNPTQLKYDIRNVPHPDIREKVSNLSDGLGVIINRALEKDPAGRFAHCGDMAGALRNHLLGLPRAKVTLVDMTRKNLQPIVVKSPPPSSETLANIAANLKSETRASGRIEEGDSHALSAFSDEGDTFPVPVQKQSGDGNRAIRNLMIAILVIAVVGGGITLVRAVIIALHKSSPVQTTNEQKNDVASTDNTPSSASNDSAAARGDSTPPASSGQVDQSPKSSASPVPSASNGNDDNPVQPNTPAAHATVPEPVTPAVPEDEMIWNRAQTAVKEKRFDDALADLETLQMNYPASSYGKRAHVRMSAVRDEKLDYERKLEKVGALMDQAKIYESMQSSDGSNQAKALKKVNEALTVLPDYKPALVKKTQLENALTDTKRAAAFKKKIDRGAMFADHEQWADAAKAFDAALADAPDDKSIKRAKELSANAKFYMHYTAAKAREKAGDIDAAIDGYVMALSFKKWNLECKADLDRLLAEKQNIEKGVETFNLWWDQAQEAEQKKDWNAALNHYEAAQAVLTSRKMTLEIVGERDPAARIKALKSGMENRAEQVRIAAALKDFNALWEKAGAAKAAGDLTGAVDIYRAAGKLFKNKKLSVAVTGGRDPEKERAAIEAQLKQVKDKARVVQLRADAKSAIARSDWLAAKSALDEILAIVPGDPDAVSQAAAIEKNLQLSVDLGDGVVLELVLIGAGEFEMGSETGQADEKPVHRVTISHPFYMGRYEITNAQYKRFNPVHSSSVYKGKSLAGDDQPVVNVSWREADEFCKWLNEKLGDKYDVRLPTEAEWEYAARAGKTTRYFWGDTDQCESYANVFDQSAKVKFRKKGADIPFNDGFPVSSPVGSFKPNAFGLYDIAGNVWEWCLDKYAPDAYASHVTVDPTGPFQGTDRVLRGGSWYSPVSKCRVAFRSHYKEDLRYYDIGFRIVVVARKP